MLEETRPDGYGRARGLVSNRASGRRVEVRTYAPGPALAGLVDRYWVVRWDLRGQEPHSAEILADPSVNVVFEADRSRVVGVSTRLFRRELSDAGLIRAVKLHPGAARALLGEVPVADLTDRITPIQDLLPAADPALQDAVLAPDSDQDGLVVVGRWLTSRPPAPPDPRIAAAIAAVRRAAGDQRIAAAGQLAAALGVTLRPLQRLFHDYVGASPKLVIRRFRLQEAAVRLERGDLTSIAALAAELGYSDHAHLTRDFKAATGHSPSEFSRTVGA